MSSLPPSDGSVPDWERMFTEMFGANADAVIEQLRAAGIDPASLPGDMGPMNPQLLQAALRQVQQFLATDSPQGLNENAARDIARQVAASAGPDPVVADSDRRAVVSAFQAAELWLDAATSLPPAAVKHTAWSRAEWVEATIATWNALTAPVAEAVIDALVRVLGDELGSGDGLVGFGDPALAGVGGEFGELSPDTFLRRLGAMVFGMQVGQATGELATEVFGTTDVGVPLIEETRVALVPTNVAAFAKDLDIEPGEVRQFLALREATAARLFNGAPWLRAHIIALIDEYARGVQIDSETLEETVREINPTDPEELRKVMSSGIFAVTKSPEQQATLLRLETALALVEGWVDAVSAQAALPHLPSIVPLREMIRRRRAAGGPAEQTFATLVGLELRPRRARDATTLWESLQSRAGVDDRDAVWSHPDFMPEPADLDAPQEFTGQPKAPAGDDMANFDAELEALLSGDLGPGLDDSGQEPGDTGQGPGDMGQGPDNSGQDGPPADGSDQ